jgi:hypothetical protein
MNPLLRVSTSSPYRLACVGCLIALAWGSTSHAQYHRDDCCGPQDVGRVRITYGGRVYLSMPNYDIFLRGAPTTLGDLATGGLANSNGVSDARVIYRNDRGMRFDGNEFFLHPAYPIEQITRYRYINRVVGERNNTWPPAGGFATITNPATNDPRAAYSPTTYSAPYDPVSAPPGAYLGTALNHRPMPRAVQFSGNAWAVDHGTVPVTEPVNYSLPTGPVITSPVTPATGRVTPRN